MSDQWSDKLRKRMENHQEPSPEGLWEDIERTMKQNNSIPIIPRQNKILFWSKRLGSVAAAVLVILVIADYFLREDTGEAIVNKRQATEEISSPVLNDERGFIANNNEPFPSTKNNVVVERTISEKTIYSNQKDVFTVKSKKEEQKKDNIGKEYSNTSETKKEKDGDHQRSKKQNLKSEYGYDLNTDLPEFRKRDKPAKWMTNIYAANITSGSTKKYDGYGSFVPETTPPEIDGENPVLGENPHDNPYGEILVENKYREVYTDIKHKQPVTMGVSLSYNLDEKWSLTSGLTYTILSSELRSGSDSYFYTSEQTLHYVGIPLNVNYNVWDNKKVSVYLSGGGLVEKNISGKLKTGYFVDNKFKSNKEDKISVEQLQWSLNTSVGISYNLSSKVGLYAEPGVSYYLKNGSEVETIYKEKPVNFSLRLGLRISLGE